MSDTIDFTGEELTDEKVEQLCGRLSNDPAIAKVFLSGTSLSEKSIIKICEALLDNTNVVHLDLDGNNITPPSLKKIIQLIESNYTLLYLDLKDCQLSSEDVDKIAQALRYNNTLFGLGLDDNEGFSDHPEAIIEIDCKTEENFLKYATTTVVNCALNRRTMTSYTLIRLMQRLIISAIKTEQSLLKLFLSFMPKISKHDKLEIAKFLNHKNLYALTTILSPPINNHKISFSGTKLYDMQMRILCYILSENIGIKHLDLSNTEFERDSFIFLSKNIFSFTELEFLILVIIILLIFVFYWNP